MIFFNSIFRNSIYSDYTDIWKKKLEFLTLMVIMTLNIRVFTVFRPFVAILEPVRARLTHFLNFLVLVKNIIFAEEVKKFMF